MFLSKYRDIIFAAINNFHPNINFTFEEEVNNMSFLDVLLICQSNGKIDRLFSENKQTLGFTLIETRSLQITGSFVRRAHRVSNKLYHLPMEFTHEDSINKTLYKPKRKKK